MSVALVNGVAALVLFGNSNIYQTVPRQWKVKVTIFHRGAFVAATTAASLASISRESTVKSRKCLQKYLTPL